MLAWRILVCADRRDGGHDSGGRDASCHLRHRLMTIVARHARMRPVQRELGLGMLGRRVCGRLESALRMTQIALVLIRCHGEISGVNVFVTRRTGQLAGPINGILPLGRMALLTICRGVFFLQPEGALLMSFARKQCRLKAGLVVA